MICEENNRMDIKEFREKGFLQEVNRQFFHPLGLALEVHINEDTGEETLGEIWDYRSDPEGIIFDYSNSKPERVSMAKEKAENVKEELKKHIEARKKFFGNKTGIEPIKSRLNDIGETCLEYTKIGEDKNA